MKFVQSFWSKPFFDDLNKENWNFRHFGGFPSSFLFYCSWVYSCLSIKKYYPNLHLVTDDFGIKIFKHALGLPYASFSNALNDISDYNSGAWAIGKLYTYRLQREPFCHLDGDIFLFGPVLDEIIKTPLFCQSYNHSGDQYAFIHPYVHKNFDKVPKEFAADLSSKIKYINVGVIGGNDIDVFKQYTDAAFELIDNNQDKLHKINSSLINLYYEQFLLSNMIASKNLEITSLFSKPDDTHKYNFAAFHNVPWHSQYVHLISHLKRSTEYMEQIAVRLQKQFP
ncbi:MAG: DUF6734 family protein [Bacteroidota bacterium]